MNVSEWSCMINVPSFFIHPLNAKKWYDDVAQMAFLHEIIPTAPLIVQLYQSTIDSPLWCDSVHPTIGDPGLTLHPVNDFRRSANAQRSHNTTLDCSRLGDDNYYYDRVNKAKTQWLHTRKEGGYCIWDLLICTSKESHKSVHCSYRCYLL